MDMGTARRHAVKRRRGVQHATIDSALFDASRSSHNPSMPCVVEAREGRVQCIWSPILETGELLARRATAEPVKQRKPSWRRIRLDPYAAVPSPRFDADVQAGDHERARRPNEFRLSACQRSPPSEGWPTQGQPCECAQPFAYGLQGLAQLRRMERLQHEKDHVVVELQQKGRPSIAPTRRGRHLFGLLPSVWLPLTALLAASVRSQRLPPLARHSARPHSCQKVLNNHDGRTQPKLSLIHI